MYVASQIKVAYACPRCSRTNITWRRVDVCRDPVRLSLFLSFSLSLFLPLTLSLSFSSIPSNLFLGLIIDLAPPFPTLQSFPLDTLFCSSFFFCLFLVLICLLDSCFWMFHLLEGGRCGSASHWETLSIAVASLCHQITLSQPPYSIHLFHLSLCGFPSSDLPSGRNFRGGFLSLTQGAAAPSGEGSCLSP